MGVTLLAVLQLIGGMGALAVMGWGASNTEQIADGIEEVGVAPWFALISMLVLALPPLVGGIGMLKGRSWGWWLSGFAHLYRIVLALQALVVAPILLDAAGLAPEESTRVGFQITKYALRAVITSLIYMYLLKGQVMEYFGVKGLSRRLVFARHATACAAMFVVGWIFG